ncbi:MAG TPA: DNA primase [Candidatus Omnitrophota bacterium]|nr:DNA primase [Candidatus Omnitrophota bacterium]
MSFIPEDIIAQVLDRSDIVEVISAYVPLKRAGRNFKANCPFHNEKTPSFVVNPDKRIFHCFGCGVGGNVMTFVMNQEHMEFPEAVRFLAQKAGIVIPASDDHQSRGSQIRQNIFELNDAAAEFFHQILISDRSASVQAAREYLKNRGVSLEMVKKFKMGFSLDQWDSLMSFLKKKEFSLNVMGKAGLIIAKEGKDGFYDRFRNRIMFPIFDVRNQCLGFGARALKDGVAKYINSPQTPVYTKGEHLYGFHLAKEAVGRRDGVVVVEGYMDFILPFQAGVDNLVASLGTALTVEQVRLLRRYTRNVTMLFDADQAGESAMARSLDVLIEEGMNVKVAGLKEGEDPDSFVRKWGAEAFQEKIRQARSFFDFKLEHLMSLQDCKTIEGRARVSTEMLSMVDKFDNEVIRFGYVRRLSDVLSIPEQALLLEMQKLTELSQKSSGTNHRLSENQTSQTTTGQASGTQTSWMKWGARTVEHSLLKLILEEEELVPLAQEISLNDFQDQDIREIMTKIFDLTHHGKEVNVSNLMNCFKDREILQKISQLMASDSFPAADKIKMFRDCVKRLKTDRVKLKRQDLSRQIRLAEVSGNDNRVDELKEQFNQLIKEAI